MQNTNSLPPFEIMLSSDAELFLFNDSWDHTRHYAALFNAQEELLRPWRESGKRWAMIADWRTLLVQVPASERLCVRSLQNFSDWGLSYYAPVTCELALAKWQTQQVADCVSELPIEIYQSFDEAKEQLNKMGFDINFESVPFNPKWLTPSDNFTARVKSLGQDPSAFGIPA